MRQSEVKFDLSKLTTMRKRLGMNNYARVGILGKDASKKHVEAVTRYDEKTGKAKRVAGTATGLTNVELGIIHEFGSMSKGIPIRSFLRMPLMEKSREIVSFFRSKPIRELVQAGEIRKVFKLLGIKGEQIVQRAFETQGFGHWPSVKPATAKAKGNKGIMGTAQGILIDTAQLRRSISSDVKVGQ